MIKTAAQILAEIGGVEKPDRPKSESKTGRRHQYQKFCRRPSASKPTHCELPGCEGTYFCKGMCSPHYYRNRYWGSPYGGRTPHLPVSVIGPI